MSGSHLNKKEFHKKISAIHCFTLCLLLKTSVITAVVPSRGENSSKINYSFLSVIVLPSLESLFVSIV